MRYLARVPREAHNDGEDPAVGDTRVRVRDGGDLLSARWKSTAREDPTGGVVGLGGEQVICFEDIVIGECMTSSAIVVDRDELVDFAERWDPLPIHVNGEVAASRGGPTAPGVFILALKQRLIHELPEHAVIASFGYDEVRFHHPLRPGDEVRLRFEYVDTRRSSSKPDRGIVTVRLSLVRNEDEVVMSHLDTILVRRRFPLG